MADTIKNLADSTVATAPSPATSGTSLVVAAGEGTRFAVGPAVIWPSTGKPTAANAEIVRITNVSTDTLTITRQAEAGGINRTVVVGDQIHQPLTAALLAQYLPLTAGTTVPVTGILDVLASARFKGPGPWVDVMSGGFTRKCSASIVTTTGSISSGTNSLVVSSATGWEVGHGIWIVLDAGTVFRSYVTVIAGTTFTLNDNAPSAATSKNVGHDDTLAIQDAIDFANANAAACNVVYVPPGFYYIWQLKLYGSQTLFLAGRSALFSVPGNTSSAMVVLNAATVAGVRITGGAINGNNTATPAPTCVGILIDNTGQVNKIDHFIVDVIVKNTGGDGVSLKSVVQSKVNNLTIEFCNGHGFRTDSLCFDNTFNAIRCTQAGLNGVQQDGSGDLYTALHVGSSGQVDFATYGDDVNVTGRANAFFGWVGHAKRHGLHINGGQNNTADILIHSNAGDHIRCTGALNNRIRAGMGYNNTEVATSIVNIDAASLQNDIEVSYYTGSLAANTPPAQGAGLSGCDNYIVLRNGTRFLSGDWNIFEGEPFLVLPGFIEGPSNTIWEYPGAVEYELN